MKRFIPAIFILVLFACSITLLNCGSDTRPAQVAQTQTAWIAFMQAVPGQNYIFTPMLGTFTSTGGQIQFTATPLEDPATNQAISAEFYSITLAKGGKKATVDLWGGLDGNSGQWDIWIGNVADASMVQVTNDVHQDWMAQLSPDGTKVVYSSARGPSYNWNLITRNADGSGEQLLPVPPNVEFEFFPTYSPEGSKIAFHAEGHNPDFFAGIWIVNSDGTNPLMLTNPVLSETCFNCYDTAPAFSPDGRKIAFARYDPSTITNDIYVMNVDGSNLTKLTDGVGLNFDPMFVSVGGTNLLVFSSNRDNLTVGNSSGFEIYSMKADGSGITRLTNNTTFDAFCMYWYTFVDTLPNTASQQRIPSAGHHAGNARW